MSKEAWQQFTNFPTATRQLPGTANLTKHQSALPEDQSFLSKVSAMM